MAEFIGPFGLAETVPAQYRSALPMDPYRSAPSPVWNSRREPTGSLPFKDQALEAEDPENDQMLGGTPGLRSDRACPSISRSSIMSNVSVR
ncbi:hypothetical protein [Ensifer sp.]|uniref:hypothetical protein n=1 Tax=Ensifer sp. TaxID=1872086 RepID=UPI0028970923|nr:hypothetical protein [Ensifer sp.]